ncbi:MAG TPA: hypothetical protein VEJ44_07505, partial [Acidimicrobiales bacterium]|nr:hypothetical protein [Acidimicrobiales bacterium]
MTVLLLAAAFGFAWFLLHTYRAVIGFGRLSVRGTMVLAYLAFEFVLLLVTELTSAGSHFTATTEAAAWAGIVVVLAALSVRPATRVLRRDRALSGLDRRLRTSVLRLGVVDRAWLGVVIV